MGEESSVTATVGVAVAYTEISAQVQSLARELHMLQGGQKRKKIKIKKEEEKKLSVGRGISTQDRNYLQGWKVLQKLLEASGAVEEKEVDRGKQVGTSVPGGKRPRNSSCLQGAGNFGERRCLKRDFSKF